MSNGTDQRIRHVAIVLQSLDAATSRGLLAQLPPAQSKLVRQALVNLGTVTPQDRETAFQSMKGRLGDSSAKQTRSASNYSSVVDSRSPAAELLASQAKESLDQLEWSQAALQSIPTSNAPDNNSTGQRGSWHSIPIESLAEILKCERPIVIATVLNQVSVDRATAIVQLLPIQVAGATLAAVPHLHLTDPAILKDIELELERKIGYHEPPQQASLEGLSRLQAIMDGLPESQRNIWTNAVSQSNPVLANKLGWKQQLSFQVPSKVKPVATLDTPSQQSTTDVSIPETVKQDLTSEESVIDKPRVSPLDNLRNLSDRDFVSVLHACPPQIVLLALTGAKKEFADRVERLIPSKDKQRLRIKLTTLGHIRLREVDAAQLQIAETAVKLLAMGKIGALENVTFTAAA